MGHSALSYISDEVRFLAQDFGFWAGRQKDKAAYHIRGLVYGAEDIVRDIRFEADMLVPRLQDYADKSPRLKGLFNKAQGAKADLDIYAHKASNALKPAVSDVTPEDEPAFLKTLRVQERAAARDAAEDAVIIEQTPLTLDYKP